ncbi:MAG: hypothetical protein JNM00_14060, partial [Flavobacteriales bacterium]|nr:hypothetical protein [Flavobacteriales bacterium]
AGGIVRTFTATDGCGNSTSVSVNITYVDEEAPVFTVFPEDVVALCQDLITVDDVEIAYADNCSDVNLAYSLETQAGNCAASYTQYHTWTITDACGNSTTATWVVEVVDHEPPVFIGVPADITLECGDALPGAEVTATDNCLGAVEVEFSESIEPLACGYNHIRTWTATDACGNIGIATQVVTFLDTTNPYFLSYPQNITVECGQPVPGPTIPVAYDECDGPVATIVTSEVYPGECPNTYTTEYIFRAFDGCGNYALWVQYISVVDTQGPQFDPFEPEVFLPCTAYNGVLVTATDNCSSTNIVFSDNVIQSGCDGLIERTYTATDACGNSNFAVQVIHIVDELAPVIQSFPEDVTVPCDAVPAVEEAEVQYTDNCSNVNVAFTESYVPGDCPNTYTLLRTWNLSDACGNSTIAVWTVNVYDDAAPVLYGVPDDIELECGEEVPDALVFAIDACSGPSEIGLTAETVSDGCNELFIRTWMTMDDCGNYVEASQTVTFADYTAPVLSETPADIEVPCGESIPDAPAITATDNCDGAVEVILTESNAGTDKQPLLLRTWCSEDCSGNSTCWTQTIYLCAGDVNPPAMPGPDGTADDVVQDVKIFNSAGILVMSFRTPLSKVQVIRSLQEGEDQLAPGIYTLCMGSEKPFNISQFAIVK